MTRDGAGGRCCSHRLNLPPHMLRRRSCPVRAHEDAASPVSPACVVSGAGGVPKRALCLANARLEVAIQAAHVRTRQTYGPERLQAELRDNGFPAGIERLGKKLGLRCQQVRRFTNTTNSTHSLPVAENVLAQTFVASRPNEAWVTDITYLPTAERSLYLAGIKDLFTREV